MQYLQVYGNHYLQILIQVYGNHYLQTSIQVYGNHFLQTSIQVYDNCLVFFSLPESKLKISLQDEFCCPA